MMRIACAVLVALALPACGGPVDCAPGEVPNEVLQACVIPKQCAEGMVDERNECVEPAPHDGGAALDMDAGTRTRSFPQRGEDAGGVDSGTEITRSGSAGSAPARSDASVVDAAVSVQVEPKCGDGIKNGTEVCDGADCPTTCTNANECVVSTLEGSAARCDARCVDVEITACASGDGCCAKGCDHGSDTDCSPSCGDGVITGSEKCERGSADHPCPTATDCDDADPCTDDKVTGTAEQCSAQCAHTQLTREPITCDDSDPCTEDRAVESTMACTFECQHSAPRARTGSCVDSDPCTVDTPVPSTTACENTCPHTLITQPRNGDGCCPGGLLRREDSDCTAECNDASDCPQRMNCSMGRCVAPPIVCGDGIVDPSEQCDDGNQDTSDSCVNCQVARCGDGYLKASEECDPEAADWKDYCTSSCTRTLYGICPTSGCLFEGESVPCASAGAYCTPICTQDSDCPALPGARVECTGAYQCTIRCSGGCPNGMQCINGDHCGYR